MGRMEMTKREKNNAQLWFARGWNYVVEIRNAGKPKKFVRDLIQKHIADRSRKNNYFDKSYMQGIKSAINYISLGQKPREIIITQNNYQVSMGPGKNWHGTSRYYDRLDEFKNMLPETEIKYIRQILTKVGKNA